MALWYLIDSRPSRYVALEVDSVADEATSIVYANLTDDPWPIEYEWKDKTGQSITIPAQTAESSIGIPPGQRKFVTGGTKPGTNASAVGSKVGRVSG